MIPIIIDKKTFERFWSKVKKTDYCWEWTASLRRGYGQFSLNGKQITAHRFSYELVNGKIPKELELDHLCRNHSCVNPDHLEAVTHRENILRGETLQAINARKTHCIQGHEFTPENTYQDKSYRQCKICRHEYQKKYKPLHRKEAIENTRKYRQKNKA